MNFKPYITSPRNAEDIALWLRNYGGIAIWDSSDLSGAHGTVATPVNISEGKPYPKPTWWTGDKPACVITDFANVLVSEEMELTRFRVTFRKGSELCTRASSRRIQREVAKAGAGAYHVFESSEAVIMKPKWQLPLLEYLNRVRRPQ